MNKKPTIKTMAGLLGVSHVTVSKALRDYPDISAEMKLKVKTLAKELGYTPNAMARSLSSKNQKGNLGMIVPATGNETIYSDVFNSISSTAAENNLCVLLGSSNRNVELEKSFCRLMCENQVGALIVSPLSSNVSHIHEICNQNVPVIFMGGKTGLEEEFCLVADYKHSAYLAVNHLYSLGHRDIALFLYHPSNNTVLQKEQGFQEEMKKKSLIPKIYWEGMNTNTQEAGRLLTKQLILENNLPTAIWCASDLMAMGVLEVLFEHHIKVPEDVSVMGHDNLYFSQFPWISLTTLELPKKQMGIDAVNLAVAIMKDQQHLIPNQLVFKPSLILRKTTGPAPS